MALKRKDNGQEKEEMEAQVGVRWRIQTLEGGSKKERKKNGKSRCRGKGKVVEGGRRHIWGNAGAHRTKPERMGENKGFVFMMGRNKKK